MHLFTHTVKTLEGCSNSEMLTVRSLVSEIFFTLLNYLNFLPKNLNLSLEYIFLKTKRLFSERLAQISLRL